MASCHNSIQNELYKTQTNLKRRKTSEIQKHAILIDKLARTDVQENMDELLSEAEKKEMQMMERVVDMLSIAELKLNEKLMILRDF